MDADAWAWQAAGIYDPAATDAADRLGALRLLTARGATLEELRAAVAGDGLAALASSLYQRRDRLSPGEVAARAGMPLDLVRRVLRAAGLGDPDPDPPRLVASDVHTVELAGMACDLFGVEATLQFTRVLGDALARRADAAMTNFGQNVAPALDAEGAGELARVEASDAASRLLFEEVPGVIASMFFHACEDAVRRSATAGAAATSELTVGFVDLVGSAALDLVDRVAADPVLPQLRGGLAAGGLVRATATTTGRS